MVAFGKKLKESQIQEWQGYYINYKLLKKKVNRYVQQLELGAEDHRYVLKDFSRMLDNQIEKIVLFLLEQQGQLASRLSGLGEQHDAILQQSDQSRISELQEAYRGVGHDLLRLLFFVEMNATGLRKILKKFDKRLGYRFTNYYVKTRANHPYSQLRQVFRHVGIGAVVGAISRNLADLQHHQGNYVSIYDQPALSHPDPVVHSIKAAVNRLSNSTTFLEFLGKHAFIMQEDLPTPSEEDVAEQRYHFMSLLLNLVNTFLYMVNTYIIVPTADNYSLSLGAAATVCGVVIGSMAVAQVFSSVYFSAWSNRSYLRPLVFSSIVLLIGNTLYALAFDLNSIAVLLVGRLFCGEPPKEEIQEITVPQQVHPGSLANYAVENGFTQPLLLNTEAKQQGQNEDQYDDGDEDSSEESPKPVTSIVSAYRLLTPSVKVQLFVYFMLKYAMEIVLAESSVITAYYFIWSTGSVAIFLACLGLTVLPVNIIVGTYISNMFEERQVLLASEIMVLIGILLSFHIGIPYSVPQYVGSALITFVSAEVLEGVNLSLLSRVMSSRLSRGTYNGGLLSTEAGTIARVIADGTITLSGYLGVSRLLNTTLIPSLLICICSIVATCFTYNSLY
ncbi:hypothetical protein COLO4_12636 [Corchorus olitorius]|uniref:SPX domain-containing protein n=1 Tax=Corchorus olitorius TaxID=93759 RepID=A0A1R3K073_9ROSI|nr:hypothetical protein COLO4_12636 [Corchorus olitorius]